MTKHLLDDFQGITEANAKTHGEKLYARYGITGIRGEAANGYPTVFSLALPAFRSYRTRGFSTNDAGILTLLHIIAGAKDTNVLARSDYGTMKKVREEIRDLLDSGLSGRDYIHEIRQLDQKFIQMNISPGGSADMLALTYFIYSLEEGIVTQT
jgi:holo-ACP synthase/triphosphoribosyl-dephospho-CoA synthase